MEEATVNNKSDIFSLIFFILPLTLPFYIYLFKINIGIIVMNYNVPSFLILLFAFMLMPKIKSNVIITGIGFIMILFSYLFSFLAYSIENVRVEMILIQLILVTIIFSLLNRLTSNKIFINIHTKKYIYILYWFFYIISSSFICSMEMLQLNHVENMFVVTIISISLGWFGKSTLFDKFRGEYAYVKVFTLQLLLLIIIGFVYGIIIGDYLRLESISWDGPIVWILSILQISSVLISKICYEEYKKIN